MKPPINTILWKENSIYIIDQRYLPNKEKIIRIKDVKGVCDAIKKMKIRGAPAIGVMAAYGVALCGINSKNIKEIKRGIEKIRKTRPTAYNLFYSLKRMESIIERKDLKFEEIKRLLIEEAEKIYNEDLVSCYKIGENGEKLIKNGMNILTHCNAGGLATTGFGTALSVFFISKKKGKKFHIFVDETRPVLQGARLTTWELEKANIPYTLICDNMAGYLMKQGKIDMVIVGADRIARNGDTANKIGTYSLAVLAKYHNIDFYVAAPSSTFDLSIKDGKDIPIEERDPEEVRGFMGKRISPKNCPVYNPAFDITPAELIKGFITEKGIIRPPYEKNIYGKILKGG
ncbi:MAG: S-methyl-5-thioribose-1-phosphate isomerase [Candidatus Omnitrophota bacterium]|nr:MAG: S-methyl-5-thioribose-1-phosphate isomerase [Candidatus Omnitrophota bacterium]